MKVSELIKQLEAYPQDHEVWVASDEEGNHFSELYEATHQWLFEDGYDSSTVAEEDIGPYYSENDLKKVVVIWP